MCWFGTRPNARNRPIPDLVASPGASPAWHQLTVEAALAAIASRATGLSDDEAAVRLHQYGPNSWSIQQRASALNILWDQLASVVVLLLVAAALTALLAAQYLEALAIAGVLLINTLSGFVIELRARRSMEALLKLESPRALVIRNGHRRIIDASKLVPGDIVELEAGTRVAADGRLIEAADLLTNEAALTGESLPVEKDAALTSDVGTPLADRRNMLYAGTTIARGIGRAVIVATGMATELGRVGGLVASIPATKTPLERRLDALGRRLVWLTVVIGVAILVLGIASGRALLPMLETAIALAVAAVPEGLPTVATIALAVGLRRMARRHALIRTLHSVEALGSTTVICTDKTGTLTAGEMTVVQLSFVDTEIMVEGVGYDAVGGFRRDSAAIESQSSPQLQRAAEVALLTSRARIERGPDGWSVLGDPTDAALRVFALKAEQDPVIVQQHWPLAAEIPFTSARKYTASIHRNSVTGESLAAVKGAPEAVLDLCDDVLTSTGVRSLDPETRALLMTRNHALAADALRVVALAYTTHQRPDTDSISRLTFITLVGIVDPPAPNVAATITQLEAAGIRTLMITGDQKATAQAVARHIGLAGDDGVFLDARELAALNPDQLTEAVTRTAGFARITPDQKLAIVTALQQRGEIVAMIGDGVNDAAALRKADVGVAMGLRGTDVAKETAGVVLQDDRFGTIAAAVEEGRIIYDNIRKFIFYLFSCNLAEIMIIAIATVAALPLPLLPLQILWLNLVTDTFPALALAIEPGDPDVMRRRPRAPAAALLSRALLKSMLLYAALIAAVTLVSLLWALRTSAPGDARVVTVAFSTLALAQLFHLGNARSQRHVVHWQRALANRYAVGAVVLVIALQLLAVYSRPFARLLGTVPLSANDWLVIVVLAALPGAVGQLLRMRRSRHVF